MIKEFCIALTAQDLLENRAQTKAFLEDPVGTLKQWGRELLKRPPQEAAILLLSVAITRRIPVFRALDELVGGAKESLQRFAKKGATKKKVSGTKSGTSGSQGTGGGNGKDPEKKKTGWQRFEEEDPLPGSIGGSETRSLFTQVQKVAYKEDPGRRTTFGMPDDIVVRDGRITIVEEAKMYSKRDFERLAELAKNDPNKFIEEGIPADRDIRQIRYIQFKKHKESMDYLLENLGKILKAKELGINKSDAKVEYMLKVPKWVSEESLETMKRAFEEKLNIAVKYRRIDWGGGK